MNSESSFWRFDFDISSEPAIAWSLQLQLCRSGHSQQIVLPGLQLCQAVPIFVARTCQESQLALAEIGLALARNRQAESNPPWSVVSGQVQWFEGRFRFVIFYRHSRFHLHLLHFHLY